MENNLSYTVSVKTACNPRIGRQNVLHTGVIRITKRMHKICLPRKELKDRKSDFSDNTQHGVQLTTFRSHRDKIIFTGPHWHLNKSDLLISTCYPAVEGIRCACHPVFKRIRRIMKQSAV